jgi:hypothetical protein
MNYTVLISRAYVLCRVCLVACDRPLWVPWDLVLCESRNCRRVATAASHALRKHSVSR